MKKLSNILSWLDNFLLSLKTKTILLKWYDNEVTNQQLSINPGCFGLWLVISTCYWFWSRSFTFFVSTDNTFKTFCHVALVALQMYRLNECKCFFFNKAAFFTMTEIHWVTVPSFLSSLSGVIRRQHFEKTRLGDFIRRPDFSFVSQILMINLYYFTLAGKETARIAVKMAIFKMVPLFQFMVLLEFFFISPVTSSQWL